MGQELGRGFLAGRGQGWFLDGSWDHNGDHREGTKEYFSCRLVVIIILS